MNDGQKASGDALLPGAIVVAALLIAGALVYNTGSKAVNPPTGQTANLASESLLDDDVILGNVDAPAGIGEIGTY